MSRLGNYYRAHAVKEIVSEHLDPDEHEIFVKIELLAEEYGLMEDAMNE